VKVVLADERTRSLSFLVSDRVLYRCFNFQKDVRLLEIEVRRVLGAIIQLDDQLTTGASQRLAFQRVSS